MCRLSLLRPTFLQISAKQRKNLTKKVKKKKSSSLYLIFNLP